jgi:hypothetical protein
MDSAKNQNNYPLSIPRVETLGYNNITPLGFFSVIVLGGGIAKPLFPFCLLW